MSAGISSARAAPTSPVSELSTVTNLSALSAMSTSSSTPSPVPADMNLILQERDALRQQNEQLWALVEKQRQVIFSLKAQISQLRQGSGGPAPAPGQLSAPLASGLGGLGQSPSPITAMLESPSLALPPNGPVPSASEAAAAAAAAAQQQQQPRQRTPPMQMQIQPQRANTADATMSPSSSIPTPPNDSPVASSISSAPTRSRSFSNPTAPLQSSTLASNPPMAVPVLPPKVISAPPTTTSPPAILSPVRAVAPPMQAPIASISNAPAPAPPTRSNTYPSNPMPSTPDNHHRQQLVQPQPSTPQRSATLDHVSSSPASAKSSPRKSLTITPMRVSTASDHIEPLSPKPMVAGGPASRASVISLNDPRYSYLAYYDDLMNDPDEEDAKSTPTNMAPISAAPTDPSLASADAPESGESADQLGDLAPSASGSPAKKSIVPANKAFRLGRLRPSSQLADHEMRSTARVQFAAETIIHEASDEEWGSEGEESFSNGGAGGDDSQWGNAGAGNDDYYEDDGESIDGSDLTGSDMAVAVAPTAFPPGQQPPTPAQAQAQGGVQFPQRSRSSMAAPPPHSSTSRMSQASGRVPPPRQHSRTHARDSIFLTKKNGGMYNPPRAFVNETRMSMMGANPPSAMAALQGGGGGGASGLPPPSAAPQFPTRGAASIHRNDASLPSPTTAAPPPPQTGLPPKRTAASPSAARASQFYQQQQQQQPHPIEQIDEELIRRLLSGDRSQLQEQLKGLSPAQIAALQNMLRDRMPGQGQQQQQQPGGGRPMSPRTGP